MPLAAALSDPGGVSKLGGLQTHLPQKPYAASVDLPLGRKVLLRSQSHIVRSLD